MNTRSPVAIALGLLGLMPLPLWPATALAQASGLTRPPVSRSVSIRSSPDQAFLQGCQRAFGRDAALARPYCRCYLESFRQRYPAEQMTRIGRLVSQMGRNGQILVALMLQPEQDFCRRLSSPEPELRLRSPAVPTEPPPARRE
jgi:hypothetical protein